MDLEFLEVDLQLNQIHKRINQLSDEAKKRVHTYPPTQKITPACRNSYGERELIVELRRAGTDFSFAAPLEKKVRK